jgi:hypothetical protein
MCSSALCDTLYYVRSVEAEYRKMWRYYCDQKNGVAVAGERPHMTLVAG